MRQFDNGRRQQRSAMMAFPARTVSVRARATRLRHPQRSSGAQDSTSQPGRCQSESSRRCPSSPRRRIFRSSPSRSSASRTSRAKPDDDSTSLEATQPNSRSCLKEPAEIALLQELEQRGPVIDSVLKSGENLRRAFVEAAQFGPAVDRFFTEIFVMVDDPALRKARLRLMKRLEQQILRIADISEIVSETE